MAQRHVRFNVNELARCAAEAVGAKSCISVAKYPDGMYNKSMLFTMDDGCRVVAKVPNPNAGLPHFTTASEVATMDFARNVLGTPVPNVLAWCSRAEENPVGAEYIIMERVPGIELEQVWPKMNIKDRFAVFDVNGDHITNESFAVGSSTSRETLDDGRATINFDRGPWDSLEAYHVAIGQREIACVSQISDLPKSPITLCGPGTYQPTRAKKLKALQCYLDMVRYLLPTDQTISSAHLWHDLHVANIFIDPSEPTKVVGLIDWQPTEISPLYFHARQPHIIDYIGPPITGLERPQPPTDVDKLASSARKYADTLYLQQSLCSLYNTLTHHQNPRLYAALQFQHTLKYLLLVLARNLLVDGEVTYLSQIAELSASWTDFSAQKDATYPFAFADKEREVFEADVQGVVRGMEAMRAIQDSLGPLFPEQGVVGLEQYDEALDALSQMKEQVISTFATTAAERDAWEKAWPFGT
ncbi:hypothetical protein BDW02DRAFT_586650 [Decorospora gaudefroyi]|uniref:Aminoglycoside phosphotransferase domain-containing protein n=1 Tax=Decorospora gaudefroyi TaxID=184978 RepID=A0A6A5KSF8_9PLEO|nr:hypothetical protein BDW02DRAFT_586650 [Decorospora gaudefroyi]